MCDDAPPSQDDEIVPFSVTVTGDFKDSENNFGYRYYTDVRNFTYSLKFISPLYGKYTPIMARKMVKLTFKFGANTF